MEIIEICGRSTDFSAKRTGTDTLRVKDARHRIIAPHGLSHHERDLLTEGLDYLRQRGPCVFVSIEAGRSPDAEKIVRSLARRVKSDIALRQRRARMRRSNSITVFEALGRDKQPKFGAHIVALMPNATARDKLIEILNGAAYGAHVLAKPVVGLAGSDGLSAQGGDATGVVWGAKELSPCRRLHRSGRTRRGSSRPVERPERDAPAWRQDRVLPAHLCEAPAEDRCGAGRDNPIPRKPLRWRLVAGPRCAREAKGAAEEA